MLPCGTRPFAFLWAHPPPHIGVPFACTTTYSGLAPEHFGQGSTALPQPHGGYTHRSGGPNIRSRNR